MSHLQSTSNDTLARDAIKKAKQLNADGQYFASLLYFTEAQELAKDNKKLLGTILRDGGMAELQYCTTHRVGQKELKWRFTRVDDTFNRSLELLSEAQPDELELSIQDKLERATTESFIARLLLVQGMPTLARYAMNRLRPTIEAEEVPSELLSFEMWYLRTVPRRDRKEVRSRVVLLIEQTKDFPRYDELLLIMIGGDRLLRFVTLRPWVMPIIKWLPHN